MLLRSLHLIYFAGTEEHSLLNVCSKLEQGEEKEGGGWGGTGERGGRVLIRMSRKDSGSLTSARMQGVSQLGTYGGCSS
jgi:hypothetical protein